MVAILNVHQSERQAKSTRIFNFWLNKCSQLTIRIWQEGIYMEIYRRRPQISCMVCYILPTTDVVTL
jgi:hypothetical protein